MEIIRIINGTLEENGYIIYDGTVKGAYIIDPGANAAQFSAYVKELELKVKGILLTHWHNDHVGAVETLRKDLNVPVSIHRDELAMYKNQADTVLTGGEVLTLGDEDIHVLHTPGHTSGGVCYHFHKSKLVFTGDTIFNVDIGRTDFSDSDPYKMQDSMNDVVNKWEDDTVIYPGHGDSATMKFVREHNYEFTGALY